MGGVPHGEGHLLDLVGNFYDCVIEPAQWPHALERLARLVDGCQAAIALHDTSRPSFNIQLNWNIDLDFARVMQEHLAHNPFPVSAWYTEIDQPISAFEYYGEADLKNGRWFQSTMGRFGYGDVALTVLARSASAFGGMSIHRMGDQPNFGESELATLRLLVPHLRRAVMIADLLDARALERDMLSTTLELLVVGIVLTDEAGSLIHANRAALRHLDDARVLRRNGDRISARDPKAAVELRQAIADAARGSTIDIPRAGISVPVGDLAAWVLPLDGGLRREFAAAFSAKVVVFIREIGDTQPLPAELFIRRYGITPAECRLLVLLAQGMTIAEASEMLGVALSTTKTHLTQLFHKTGTQRQAQLVRLVASAFAPAATRTQATK